jgi:t-SNARE complex subunit (syntaxin)
MENLEKDIFDLQQSMEILHEIVERQQPDIDSIESYIEQSKKEVKVEIIEEKSNFSYYASAGVILLFFIKLIL